MMQWYSKNLGDALLASAPLSDIEAHFDPAYEAAGRPVDMAVFVRHESEGRLHCEAVVYFSPAAAVVARQVGAAPCGRPSPHDLGLLGGAEEARHLLFPPSAP